VGRRRGRHALGAAHFTIDEISERPWRISGTTLYCYDVELPTSKTPGRAVVDLGDGANPDAARQHIADVLNAMVDEDGDTGVIIALRSVDGLRLRPMPSP
jgi:hypothetical protein